MTKIDDLKRYDQLYESGIPEISDEEYDILKINTKNELPNDSYFKKVGFPVDGEKVKLEYVLGSLNKVYPDDIVKWLDKHPSKKYLISEKLDGVDIYVVYENGNVIFASTRGDGYYGRNITEKAKIFCPKISNKGFLKLRGQAMLVGDVYKEIGYKTARNGVAGILNDDNMDKCKYITPFFFEVIDGIDGNEDDKIKELYLLFGRNVPSSVIWERDSKINPEDDFKGFLKSCKEVNDYEIDGLVITPIYYKRENVSYPENKVAFKVNQEGVKAIVNNIEWNITRTGRIIPVVIIEPIELQGVTIGRATGFNAKYILDNEIGSGKIIEIQRSGDVIPFISKVHKDNIKAEIPEKCPFCSEKSSWKGVDIICTNTYCDGQAYYRVEHYLIRMGAENITYKTLMKLGLNEIEKCYEIDEWEIASIDGFGVKRAQQIINEIQGTLNSTPEAFISAFGIPGVGRTVSKLLIDHFGDWDNFAINVSLKNLEKIDGIGPITAKNIMNNLDKMFDLYDYFSSNTNGLVFDKKVKNKLDGMIFTLTGKGSMSRGEYQKIISNKGGIVKGISKNTSYLVTDDMESNSGKMKKAKSYGTVIISYDELLKMLEEA